MTIQYPGRPQNSTSGSISNGTEPELRQAAFEAIVKPVPVRVGLLGRHRQLLCDGWDTAPATIDEAELLIWTGPLGNSAQSFWIPCPYTAQAIRKAVDLNDHRAVADWHKGLTGDSIPWRPCALNEIDHLPLAAQVELYAEFERVTGVRFGLEVLSGDGDQAHLMAAGLDPAKAKVGKSLHGYWLFDRALVSSQLPGPIESHV